MRGDDSARPRSHLPHSSRGCRGSAPSPGAALGWGLSLGGQKIPPVGSLGAVSSQSPPRNGKKRGWKVVLFTWGVLFPRGFYPPGVLFLWGLFPGDLFLRGFIPRGFILWGFIPQGSYSSWVYSLGIYSSGFYSSGILFLGVYPLGFYPL